MVVEPVYKNRRDTSTAFGLQGRNQSGQCKKIKKSEIIDTIFSGPMV